MKAGKSDEILWNPEADWDALYSPLRALQLVAEVFAAFRAQSDDQAQEDSKNGVLLLCRIPEEDEVLKGFYDFAKYCQDFEPMLHRLVYCVTYNRESLSHEQYISALPEFGEMRCSLASVFSLVLRRLDLFEIGLNRLEVAARAVENGQAIITANDLVVCQGTV